MVALFVLTTGFLGILSLLAQSLALSKTVSNDTIATYLAAEGIELAKNFIDHDVYTYLAPPEGFFGGPWGTTCFTLGGSFEIDYTSTDCSSLHTYLGVDPPDFLSYSPTTNQYLYAFNDITGTAKPTIFKRGIKVIPNSGSPVPELTVQSIVTWNVGLATNQLMLEDHFYNWYP